MRGTPLPHIFGKSIIRWKLAFANLQECDSEGVKGLPGRPGACIGFISRPFLPRERPLPGASRSDGGHFARPPPGCFLQRVCKELKAGQLHFSRAQKSAKSEREERGGDADKGRERMERRGSHTRIARNSYRVNN